MKKINVLVVLSMLSTLFMAMTCDDGIDYHGVTFENKTNDTIWVAFDDSYGKADSLTSEKVFLGGRRVPLTKVLPNDSICSFSVDETDDYGNRYYSFLVFKQQTLNSYPVFEIAKRNLYDAKFAFNYRYLEKINFKVVYEER